MYYDNLIKNGSTWVLPVQMLPLLKTVAETKVYLIFRIILTLTQHKKILLCGFQLFSIKWLGTPRQRVAIVEETDAETKEVYITVILPYIQSLNNSYFNQST